MKYKKILQQGRSHWLPQLPTIAGDEGFGEVLEIGNTVTKVRPGQRVVLKSRLRGTWRLYAVFEQTDLQVVSSALSLAEAATISIAPRMAYLMLLDFKRLRNMQSIVQTAASSPCGQMIIQLCKLWDIDSINILGTNNRSDEMKNYLLNLGASAVLTLEEAENIVFNTSVSRPLLGLNALEGRHQELLLKFMAKGGSVVNYGNAFNMPFDKMRNTRPDLTYHKFHIVDYDLAASSLEQDIMFKYLVSLMAVKKLRPPLIKTVDIRHYIHAMKYESDDFSTLKMFDFSSFITH